MKYKAHSFIAVLVFSVILALSACQQEPVQEQYVPESASALWQKVDETMNTSESMEMRSKVQAVFYSDGYEFELEADSYIFSSKQTHYAQRQTVLSCEELSLEQTNTMVEAYYDGKLYTLVTDGEYEQKFCSAMTHEEYDQSQSGEETDELSIADCTNAQYVQNEDGTWSLEFSGYTKKAIDIMVASFGTTPDMLVAPVEDVKVTLTVNADFYVQKMEFSFEFGAGDEGLTPVFCVTAEYSNYNTAEFDTALLNIEEYTEVDDLRILEAVQSAIEQRQNEADGKFSMELKSTYQLQEQTSVSEEQITVSYGRKNGAYFYNSVAKIDRKSFALTYSNGQQEVTVSGETTTGFQSEAEAKEYIDGLINMANYSSIAVTDIQKLDEGVYLLSVQPTNLEQTVGLVNIDEISAGQEITVTFESNELVKIESELVVSGKYNGQAVTLTVESVVTFEEA